MTMDDRALDELIERSQDLQSDAMTSTHETLDELVEVEAERRAHGETDPEESRRGATSHQAGIRAGLAAGGALAATAFSATLLGLSSSPAFAASSTDVQMLQTSASLENLAVTTYKTALTLPYIGGSSANKVIKAFAETTMSQHKAHSQAFNSAIKALGGKKQTNPDPKYVPTVKAAVTAIAKDSAAAGALAVVDLAITLENVAAETYIKNCSLYSDSSARVVTASIMGVEAQHVATLAAVRALLKANATKLIALSPTVAASLPAAAGNVAFPHSFYPTSMASPAHEGALS